MPGRRLHKMLKLLIGTAAIMTGCSENAPQAAPTALGPGAGASDRTPSNFVLTPSSLDWQQQARDLVGTNKLSPIAAARVYAALSVAEYRAVMATDNVDTDGELPAEGLGTGGRSALEAQRGAVAGASAEVMSFFFPTSTATFEQMVVDAGNAGPGNVNPHFTRGLAIGRGVGVAMVERTKNDHFTAPFTGTFPTGPGIWFPTGAPVGATMSGVTPYVLTSASQFRPGPPPTFGSADYNTALQEIHDFSANRTLEQRATALFWNFPTGSYTPMGYWDLATANYVQSYGLDERGAAHAFAMTTAAMMDAFIGCYDAKYYYLMIRPPQVDDVIKTNLVFPLPNHPSYPSAHSCASAAAGTVLTSLFPDRASELAGWVTQAGLSRMYAGIHYRFDIDAGQTLGTNVGQLMIAADRHQGLLTDVIH